MDFILVADALTASEARYALAQRNTMGARVGSFSVLLETLAELWLIESSDLDWGIALQEQALAMADVFWKDSVRVDEPATMAELKTSLQFLLNSLPLGTQPAEISEPANRYERYYNDLVSLFKRIGERPAQDELAEQWLAEHQELCIEPLYVYPRLNTERLYPWQQQILSILSEKCWLAPEPEKYGFILEPTPANESAPVQQFAQTLFHPAADTILCEGLHWLTCRDHVQEVEAVTSLIQTALDKGTAPERIAVVVPQSGDYELWLEKHFEYAGIISSNVRQDSKVFDWQSSLIHDLFSTLVQPEVPMGLMSVMVNPLMPWSAKTGYKFAEHCAKRKMLTSEEEIEQTLLDLLQLAPEKTTTCVIDWLKVIIDLCRKNIHKGLNGQRMKGLLQNIERLLFLYNAEDFEERINQILRQMPVATLNSSENRIRYLNAINIIQEKEPLPFQVDQLFILGFNQGHYSYRPEHTGAIPREAWDSIASTASLAVPTTETSQEYWQKDFTELLNRADKGVTFLRATNNYLGEPLESSETLLDMALCFQVMEDLAPEDLETPILQSSHPLLRTETIEVYSQASPELDDLYFGDNLQKAKLDDNGDTRRESPSSLEKLMLSPLAWLLNRLYIESRIWEPQTPDIRIQGNVAHKVFELFFHEQQSTVNESLIGRLFDQAVDEEAPFLNTDRWSLKRIKLRDEVSKALNDLAGWCVQLGWQITQAEGEIEGSLWGIKVRGRVDAILSDGKQALIVDYKKSKHANRLTRLEKGYDLQTYIYKALYQQGNPGSSPLSGYFTLNDSTLVTDQALPGSGALSMVRPKVGLDAQSENAVAFVGERLKAIQAGKITLNQTDDVKEWGKLGITDYSTKDNPVITRFIRNNNEEVKG